LLFNRCRFTTHPSLVTHSQPNDVDPARLDFFSYNLLATI
jgi:hypothetical protein